MSIVIRGGEVIDGTAGAEPIRADVLVERGRITAIGDLSHVDAAIIDASGCVVAPGFIDLHSHSDLTLLVDPRACSAIAQGVTTEVVGNCGHGCFPIRDPDLARRAVYGASEHVALMPGSAASYLTRLEASAPAVNVATLVPHGQLRLAVVGLADRPATPDELDAMRRLLDDGLDEGAWGLSTGLEYPQERGATEREIALLCHAVASRDGLYATHTRDRAADALGGVEEALRTARMAGVRLQVSHLVPRGGLEQMLRCIDLVDDGASAGLDVGFDMHTRLFGFTHLSALLPTDTLVGDRNVVVARLKSVEFRERVRHHVGLVDIESMAAAISIDGPTSFSDLAGRDLQALAAAQGGTPADVACDLLLANLEGPEEVRVRLATYTREQQLAVFPHPLCIPASDATSLCPDGPLADTVFHGAYDWAAWFLRSLVREEALLELPQAVHRLTLQPATRLGLEDRGRLRAGAAADIVVLDPSTIGETTTATHPNRLAVGIRTVLVNGEFALRDGAPTGQRSGRVLRAVW